jgi:GT2 family glycosyltransferase
MRIAIAVMTWNRLPALKQILAGLAVHCPHHHIAVFEDAGTRDDTIRSLTSVTDTHAIDRPEYAAYQVSKNQVKVFLGAENLGVAGNSNRALRWFMDESNCDYLCLCNDDLVVKGDFATYYTTALRKLQLGLLCFCGFTSKAYAWDPIEINGYTVKKLGRMTGAMMAMPRELVARIGYFDMRFGKFGEEHCDFTNRARLAGFQQIQGKAQMCLDVENQLLEHLDVDSTIAGPVKQRAEAAAVQGVRSIDYLKDGLHRPFSLGLEHPVAGVDGDGISPKNLPGYYDIGTKQVLT